MINGNSIVLENIEGCIMVLQHNDITWLRYDAKSGFDTNKQTQRFKVIRSRTVVFYDEPFYVKFSHDIVLDVNEWT